MRGFDVLAGGFKFDSLGFIPGGVFFGRGDHFKFFHAAEDEIGAAA